MTNVRFPIEEDMGRVRPGTLRRVTRASVGYSERSDAVLAGRLAAAAAAGPMGRDDVRTLLLVAVGPHAPAAAEVARGAHQHCPHATIAVVGGGGAMVPEGEIQGIGAVVALALRVESCAHVGAEEELEGVGRRVRHRSARPLLFFARRGLSQKVLDAFGSAAGASALAGGATAPGGSLAVVTHAEARQGALLAMRIDGGLRIALDASVAIHGVGPERTVTSVDGGYVTGLDGQRPLTLLGHAAGKLEDGPLVLVRWFPGGAAASVIRGIGGIDPKRGAIFVGRDVARGDRLGYCVPDSSAGRDDLRACLDRLRTKLFGGTPVAAIVVESVGRGVRLHGKPHVDARMLRRELGDVPFIGVRTAQEIVRVGDRLRVAGHTMVVGLLFAPS